jgi:hypothetical protein
MLALIKNIILMASSWPPHACDTSTALIPTRPLIATIRPKRIRCMICHINLPVGVRLVSIGKLDLPVEQRKIYCLQCAAIHAPEVNLLKVLQEIDEL